MGGGNAVGSALGARMVSAPAIKPLISLDFDTSVFKKEKVNLAGHDEVFTLLLLPCLLIGFLVLDLDFGEVSCEVWIVEGKWILVHPFLEICMSFFLSFFFSLHGSEMFLYWKWEFNCFISVCVPSDCSILSEEVGTFFPCCRKRSRGSSKLVSLVGVPR